MKLARLMSTHGTVHTVNIDAIVEVAKSSQGIWAIYLTGYCLAHGQQFRLTDDEVLAMSGGDLFVSAAVLPV
jgi:hypothetical protein